MTDMFSPGATLRAAREKRKLTQADISEATRIKVHVIDAIENNDFSGVSAPVYGKGFIKMYAESVGLDPEPLLRDYMERHARAVHPSLQSERPPATPTNNGIPMPSTLDRFKTSGGAAWDRIVADLVSAFHGAIQTWSVAWVRWRMSRRGDSEVTRRYTRGYAGPDAVPMWRYLAIGMAVVVAAALLVSLIGLLSTWHPKRPRAEGPSNAKPALPSKPLRLMDEPPPAHIRSPGPR
jgi:transcriptional regulator with XRE-family HTH domain